jgi:hypothetical protein
MANSWTNLIRCLEDKLMTEECHKLLLNGLKEIVLNPSAFTAVWHPVGFIHVNLAESERANLRLHLWVPIPEEFRGLGWQIHDHTWSLTSYVICGSITNSIYSVHTASKMPTHRIYEVKYDGRINYLESTDVLITYKTEEEEVLTRGDIYTIQPRVFHSSDSDLAIVGATLVLSEKTGEKNPRVIGILEGNKTYTMERYLCNENVLRAQVNKVLETL